MQLESPRRRRNLVSLTPLIDVVFILLVFFMLASSFQQWRAFELDVPGEGGGSSERSVVLVRLTAAGEVLVDGEPATPEDFAQRVRAAVAEDSGSVVSVQPDAEVPLQRIIATMDRLAQAGIRDASLVEE